MQFDASQHLANAMDLANKADTEPNTTTGKYNLMQITAQTDALLSIASSLINIHNRLPAKTDPTTIGQTVSAGIQAAAAHE